ncbi:MAG: bifunctional phosphopantothenoylcysteine decarboxylase/phosphopantothenate--cysteine ligase CoaBC [Acidobacteria bacterium]|nr:bifunctional phosphopantothenoylcysteine decarboxylase/phosphopantothenate--cysteine ligase CoaBC [Acidobacteriota bacterium]
MSPPRVLLGVGGGIAAYKAAELVRSLVRDGAEVQVILTARAAEFVTPLTLATLSGREVAQTEFPPVAPPKIGHIELARWGDALVVAPATANILARFARGLADDLLSTVYLAFQGPVVVAPAMNPKMWDHPETRENIERLARNGVVVVDPEEGYMACGDEGAGRLATIQRIAAEALWAARRSRSLAGVRVVVSAGPTHEPLDPVRFVGNRSSGKMGFAVAAAAVARGADVTLVAGPTAVAPPFGPRVLRVETALEMREAVRAAAAHADVVIMVAAVADYRPRAAAGRKISGKDQPLVLELVPNPDILAELCRQRRPGQVIVGFAAETGDAVAKGRAKRERKGCDLLAVNDVTTAGAEFGADTNVVALIGRDGAAEALPLMPKRAVAERLLDAVARLRNTGESA